jgi:hypothetical protein
MNDPHVESLHYLIQHSKGDDYSRAVPLDHDAAGFAVRIERSEAIVLMKEHFATPEAARAVVEPSLRAWELSSALAMWPGITFVYQRAALIDRSPNSGSHALHAASTHFALSGMVADLIVQRAAYPAPPVEFAVDPCVDMMFDRYRRYREQLTTIGDCANFCLTALGLAAGGRGAVAYRFAIAPPVLRKLGELCATKGGKEARKAEGTARPFSPAERQWLDDLMLKIIRRAAEVAHDPNATRPQIIMADLPDIA